ncbi:caspase-8-like [Penaeus indicus]|uniref:caspase-8-like n=1 Tax=Penaeus indicus TaxID=29960 RepID=UPI00300D74BE
MSGADDSARPEAQPKDGRDGGNQGKANTTETRGAEAEEPAKNGPCGRYPTIEALVDYTKTVAWVETEEVMSALEEQGVDLMSFVTSMTMQRHLYACTRTRNPSSSREGFADDIIIFFSTKEELQQILVVLNEASKSVGLRMNFCKTKVMCNKYTEHADVIPENENLQIEEVEHYIFSKRDHSRCDALVIVFMSHGELDDSDNVEYLCAKDGRIATKELWKNFTAENCTGLAGKPKLYFIQACRGDREDKGVNMSRRGMAVQTDSIDSTEEYVIPIHADQLVMWASYPGFPAFKSTRKGIQRSVFIHYLAENLKNYANTSPRPSLSSILLKVSREVAVLYESNTHDRYNENKQVPYIHSTLLREIYV